MKIQPMLSLRVKLVLTYLGVALGAIVILGVAVAWAVQSYFIDSQREALRLLANYRTEQIEQIFQSPQDTLNSSALINYFTNAPEVVVVSDPQGKTIICSQPRDTVRNCDNSIVHNALRQVLDTRAEVDGEIVVTQREASYPSQFVALPINNRDHLVGAMLISSPEQDAAPFIQSVRQTTIIVGVLIGLGVLLLSFWLAKRLTKPLEVLTEAAEQVKRGNYQQRVPYAAEQDELGRLANTFNAMANKIEQDVNELRHQEQVRRDLAANIAHDLATPLTAIQGFSEALADEVIASKQERQEIAYHIGREVQRLRRLVSDMQQMSSLEAGHTRLDLAPLDLSTLAEETLFVIEPECQQQGITVRNDLPSGLPDVMADGDRIAQVLLNLLDNARRHTSSGGTITIGAEVKGDLLAIWIRDTGVGIPGDDLPHIFERFYRGDRSRTSQGSGLGLSIVRAIIAAHRGQIWARSQLGKGTQITFALPLAPKKVIPLS